MCNTLLVMNRGKAVETLTRDQLQNGAITEVYTRQLLLAGKGYDRTAIDRFEDF
jgi:peptide/nickel transport system ATP-binding protein